MQSWRPAAPLGSTQLCPAVARGPGEAGEGRGQERLGGAAASPQGHKLLPDAKRLWGFGSSKREMGLKINGGIHLSRGKSGGGWKGSSEALNLEMKLCVAACSRGSSADIQGACLCSSERSVAQCCCEMGPLGSQPAPARDVDQTAQVSSSGAVRSSGMFDSESQNCGAWTGPMEIIKKVILSCQIQAASTGGWVKESL